MIDLFKKTLEASLGAVAMTSEKLKEIADDLVVKGNLTEKEGMDIFKDFEKIAGDSQKKLKGMVEDQVHHIIKDMGIATLEDVKALEGKISRLEKKLEKKDKKEKK